ncbi:ABC transporter ATP-binding protein [Schnuerera sp. xch1]|uniref:ATP-binding cassette domain-containing protein n=1 Tax=Schnuerera sp. xch1 TaxID=2874283 RepID=UPI001CBBAF03|nr:ABC transporter ATP-binding protein [Schnuerera sp. xch1]MBZ2174019.1 ABC transporter ATP-binding protein [Schnuerera sp. xch1]
MINFANVYKKYKDQVVIDDITIDINKNGIYCLLGRNGAGKTTFMKLLAGHIGVSEGEIKVDKQKVSPANMPSNVSFIESRASQFNMSIADLLDTTRHLQDEFDIEFAYKMLQKFKLNKKQKFKQLSFGMQTMVATIAGLASNSKVVMLDEPVLGFDAIMRNQFNKLLLESYERHPRIIIVSTHLIDEIAKVAQYLIMIDNGKIILNSTMNEINDLFYALTGQDDALKEAIKNLNVIGKETVHGRTVAYIYDKKINLTNNIINQPASLNDFFINMVGGNENE